MNIELIYLHVVGQSDANAPKPDYYAPYSERFHRTYLQFTPTIGHSLTVVSCGGDLDDLGRRLFGSMAQKHLVYDGPGWDIGAQQFAARQSTASRIVCMATPVYFWKAGWLERLMSAFGAFGDGLYGPQGSYEHNPHIRTSCYATTTKLYQSYPHLIDSRSKCADFESGLQQNDWNFTRWASTQGLPVRMVTWDGYYIQPDWRKPDNVFRKGDQSSCLIWDRHNDIYRASDADGRLRLERAAENQP